MTDLSNIRRDYGQGALHRRDLDADPITQFEKWLNDAIAAGQLEPTAFTLATCTVDGIPSARVVLLKRVGPDGFVFFTNYDSQKGREILANPRVEACFYWDRLSRTVRIHGGVLQVSETESKAYFASRPRKSQIGAIASQQSEIVDSRSVLEARFAQLETQYDGKDVPRPERWGGFVIAPQTIEFWQGRPSRLHDRLRYSRDASGAWRIDRISP